MLMAKQRTETAVSDTLRSIYRRNETEADAERHAERTVSKADRGASALSAALAVSSIYLWDKLAPLIVPNLNNMDPAKQLACIVTSAIIFTGLTFVGVSTVFRKIVRTYQEGKAAEGWFAEEQRVRAAGAPFVQSQRTAWELVKGPG